MIRCQRQHLEARCRERGYTLEQVRPCIVAENGDTLTVNESHPAYPHKRPAGLGDMVAAGLSAVGITTERVTKVLGKPCGCKERQAKLNRLGASLGMSPGQTPKT